MFISTSRALARRLGRAVATAAVIALAVTAGVAVSQSVGAEAAAAADASRFDPGNIISDDLFYNANTMSPQEIQAFLGAIRPGCERGYTCLKDYRESFGTRAADARCGYLQGQNMSAAEIIFWVSRACGINPQVLIVMLEKEQGLVSSSRPSATKYRIAMGYGCPDTAPCDALYYGFFNQVYSAARQFKTYQAFPNSFAYRAGRVNTILWHPNGGCGSSQVYIGNQATAGLYIYTPYRPNGAALANLYGTGDGCSSYGNRNFWRTFTDWFGATTYDVPGAIGAFWRSIGGTASEVGSPSGPANAFDANGGGWAQEFTKGYIYVSRAGASAALRKGSAIWADYAASGSQYGALGWPRTSERCSPAGCVASFDRASIGWSPSGGVARVDGPRYPVYSAQGLDQGALGVPLQRDQATSAAGGGSTQRFSGGVIHTSAAGTFHLRSASALYQTYAAAGGPGGRYGWPTSDENCVGTTSCAVTFQDGAFGWTPRGGVQEVRQASAYAQAGGATGALGAPTGPPSFRGDREVQEFTGGATYWARSGGALHLRSGSLITQAWTRSGAEQGPWGWPVSSESCSATACTTEFQRSVVSWTPNGGVRSTEGPFLEVYRSSGGPKGVLGAATSAPGRYPQNGGGSAQVFQGGFLYQATGSDVVLLRRGSAIYQRYAALGSQSGRLGWPVTSETCGAAGCSVRFQNGEITWTPAGGVQLIEGPVLAAFDRAGGAAGSLGPATGPATAYPANGGGIAQDFVGGYVYSSPAGSYFLKRSSGVFARYAAAGSQAGAYGWPRSDEKCSGAACRAEFQGGTITAP